MDRFVLFPTGVAPRLMSFHVQIAVRPLIATKSLPPFYLENEVFIIRPAPPN